MGIEIEESVVQDYPSDKPKVEDLGIAELEALLEAKRKELGKGIKASPTGPAEPPGKAPSGFLWVYNRGPETFEWQHNSVVYEIEGHSFALFPQVIAEHGRRRSLLTVDPVTNHTTHSLALPGDKDYGKPLKSIKRIEVIDRRTSADPAQLGTGEKTHVAVVGVEGGEEMTHQRLGAFAELQ